MEPERTTPRDHSSLDTSAGVPATPAKESIAEILQGIGASLRQLADTSGAEARAAKQHALTRDLLTSTGKLTSSLLDLKSEIERVTESLFHLAKPATLDGLEAQSSGLLGCLRKMLSPVSQKLRMLNLLIEGTVDFHSRLPELVATLDQRKAGDSGEFARANVANFVKMLVHAGDVIVLSRDEAEIIAGARNRLQRLQGAYFAVKEQSEESFWSRFFADDEIDKISQKVPLFKGKPLVSLLLIDLANSLPTRSVADAVKSHANLEVALRNFSGTRTIAADTHLFAGLSDDTISDRLVSVADGLEKIAQDIKRHIKESKIERALAEANQDGSREFREFFDASAAITERRSFWKEQDGASGAAFLRRHLGGKKLGITEYQEATATPQQGPMHVLYEEMLPFSVPLKNGDRTIDKHRLVELVELRDTALKGGSTMVKLKRLRHDNERGNYCFELVGGGKQLNLKQVASSAVTFDQLIGKSWKDVQGRVHALLKYQSRQLLYTDLSARGKANSNLLIIGPYGMGKNHFVRALGNERGIVTIHGSTDRLLSKWLGEAEQNVRRIFEMASETREQFGRPVVLVLDEIDSFFPGGRQRGEDSHAAIVGMQKTLQTVLDGDTIYEGVSLIGLTNEPARIPVPIYRRFGGVHLIEKFSPSERRELFRGFAAQLPMEADWEKKFPWDTFQRETEYASGDMIGKIYDRAFEQALDRVDRLGEPGLKLKEEVEAVVLSEGRISAERRRQIWAECVPQVQITASELAGITETILSAPDQIAARAQQERFYSSVQDRLREAFEGDV